MGEVVAVYDGATKLGNAVVSGAAWTYTDSTLINGDAASYTVRVEDAAGNLGASSAAFTTTISAPTATAAITAVADNAGTIQGNLVSGGVTDDTSLALSGTITGVMGVGEVVAVYDGATKLGNAVVSGTTWTYTDSTLANTDAVSYTVVVENAAGDQGVMSSAFTTTIDTAAPAAPAINAVATNDIVNDAEALAGFNITGTGEVGATVTLSFTSGATLAGGNTAVVDGSGNWTIAVADADVTAFAEGGETITASQTDAAGNTSTNATRAITVDTGIPAAPAINAVATNDIVNDAEALAGFNITGTGEVGATVTL